MKRIGTEIKLSEDERARMLEELNFWRRKSAEHYDTRDELEDLFNCIWEGQSARGLVIGDDDKAAWPFDGASDQRVRLGDKIFQKEYALIAVALSAATIEVTSVGADAEKRAANIEILLNWMLNNLGSHGWMQIRAMLHHMLVDTPAIAALDVDWEKNVNLHPEVADYGELVEEFAAAMEAQGLMAEVDATALVENCVRKAVEGELDENGVAFYEFLEKAKGMRRRDIRRILKAIGEDDEGKCEYLAKGEAEEGLKLEALRYGDDFVLPTQCEDFRYANPWFRGEWVTPEQLKERVGSDGWDAKWVEDTLAYKGLDFYNSEQTTVKDEEFKNLIGICWVYSAETNARGETIRYVTVLSHASGSAFGKRVISTRNGKWPVVLFRREVRSKAIVDGRGLAEICCPDQGLIKEIKDRANDAAIIGSLPPLVAKGTRASNAVIEPFGLIKIGSSDDVKFMNAPQFPATAKDRAKEIEDDLLDYLGIEHDDKPMGEEKKARVRDMLLQFKDLFVAMVETAQNEASDELLAGITDEGDVKGLRREDISGRFGIMLKLDPDNLNHEKLMERLKTFSQILGMDKRQEVDTSPVLRHALTALFPEISKKSIKSAETLQGEDIRNEEENFMRIKAGVMPQMNTEGGWNYGARIQWWQQLQQENPDAIAEMSPRSQEMMQQWISALEQQQRQFGENAEIGKTGVQGVGAAE